jgi:hypothetical protein
VEDPAGLDDVVHALSYRHPKPCDELEALTPTPVQTLRHVVTHVQAPPWAPMRAAECLQRNHALEVREDLLLWVRDPALKGLGRQAVGLIDVLPDALAVDVGREALRGPVADRARTMLARDARPAVAELVSAVPAQDGSP